MTGLTDSEPIGYIDGKATFSGQFTKDAVFKDVIPLFDKDKRAVEDLAAYLYAVFSPRSLYRTMPEAERERSLMRSGILHSPERLKEMLADPRSIALKEHYMDLVMLPSERLRLGLVEAIDRLLMEVSKAKGMSDTDYFALIEKGKKLHGYAKEIEAMVVSESTRKVRGSYKPQMYERRGTAPVLANTD